VILSQWSIKHFHQRFTQKTWEKQSILETNRWTMKNGSSVTMSSAKDRRARTFKKPAILTAELHPSILLIWWDWKGVMIYEFFLKNDQFGCVILWSAKQIECSEKRPKLVNRICVLILRQGRTHLCKSSKNCRNWTKTHYCILHIH